MQVTTSYCKQDVKDSTAETFLPFWIRKIKNSTEQKGRFFFSSNKSIQKFISALLERGCTIFTGFGFLYLIFFLPQLTLPSQKLCFQEKNITTNFSGFKTFLQEIWKRKLGKINFLTKKYGLKLNFLIKKIIAIEKLLSYYFINVFSLTAVVMPSTLTKSNWESLQHNTFLMVLISVSRTLFSGQIDFALGDTSNSGIQMM